MAEYYKFQFNGDAMSCRALETMFLAGWSQVRWFVDEGHTWVLLEKSSIK